MLLDHTRRTQPGLQCAFHRAVYVCRWRWRRISLRRVRPEHELHRGARTVNG